MQPVLVIAPYFAPQAAVGALRSVKLARQMPDLGYRPVVLCGSFPEDARDDSLALPEGAVVRDAYLDPNLLALRTRLRSFRRSSAAPATGPLRGMDPLEAPFDRYAVHALHASREAVRLGREQGAALVYASLGPYSAAPVALRAASVLGVPAVLDLRDPWALHEASASSETAVAGLVRRAERACLSRASHVVLNTRAALAAYRDAYPWLATRSSCIRNCFDKELYRPAGEAPVPPPRFRIVHLGRLRSDVPIDDLAGGLERLIAAGSLRPEEVELLQVGHISPHERGVLARAGLDPCLRVIDRVEYADTLSLLRGCHLQVVLNASTWHLRIPAKTYDYIASGMPVLAISPNEELDELLRGRIYARAAPGDAGAVARILGEHLTRWRSAGSLPEPESAPDELSARAAATALAEVFAQVLNGARVQKK